MKSKNGNLMNLDNFSKIGSGIGGILSSIVALISIVLVFLAYKEQINANINMREAQVQQSIQADINGLAKMIEDLKFYPTINDNKNEMVVEFSQRASIEVFAEMFRASDNQDELLNSVFFEDLYFVIGRFDVVLNRIISAKINEDLKVELFRDISFLYSAKCVKGMTELLAVVDFDKNLHASVDSIGINKVDHYKMMMEAHKKFMDLILKLQV